MSQMLINATQPEELRVAVLKEQKLFDLDIERQSDIKKKANIYKGRITRIEPSLEAAFVDYGAKRQGFLPLKEISSVYYRKNIKTDSDQRPSIQDLLTENQELLVQIEKEERGTKGAALTTYITLAGCYMVLMPNSPKGGGISRRIEGEERDALREIIRHLTIPEAMSVIVRTAGVGKSLEDIQWDLEVLLNLWNAIQQEYEKQPAPFLIHQEGDIVIRSIRDNLRRSVEEIIVDNQAIYVKTKNYLQQVRPQFVEKLKLYQDTVPLFSRFQLESQIETAYQHHVMLPSGGSIVIDRTEALVAIDINSAKSTGGANIEATAFTTNIEAADEIARQMRLRDLGGLIVIDFIDMSSPKNQREVENRLREALKNDRARVQIGHISRFGLLEMSRQRLHLSLGETNQRICTRCNGRGTIRDTQSLGLSIIRLIEEEVIRQEPRRLNAQLPVEVATYILNEKRATIMEIEQRHHVIITILANPHLEAPHYNIECIRGGTRSKEGIEKPSYTLIQQPELEVLPAHTTSSRDEPAVKSIAAPQRETKKADGWLKQFLNKLFGSEKPSTEVKSTSKQTTTKRHTRSVSSSSSGGSDSRKKPPQKKHYKGQSNYRRRRPPRDNRNDER